MKKLVQISDKINNNNYSYTGKGAFEAIFNQHKNEVILWLEELIPLQKQIEFLYEKENIEFQKRNYTRILTKFLPKEYQEFVSVNILLRDLNFIKEFYQEEQILINLYDELIYKKYLKYPGKNEKYVEFDIFEEFVITYKEELVMNNIPSPQSIEQPIIKEIEEESNNISKEVPIIPKKEEKTNWTDLLLGK